MEIEKKNRFIEFVKNYAMYIAVALVIFAVALTFSIVAAVNASVPASTNRMEFQLPMTNATIIKDFSNTELQNNETLNQWEAHLAVDLAGQDGDVFAILDGTVTKVDYSFLDGYTITLTHESGFESKYSSLKEEVLVKEGDKVKAGDKIGVVSTSASGELDLGEHLHFCLKLNNAFVDPNDYLDLQQK
ncbi:MAG: M23 family metallopeptidase [Clostridia bacterium]|nr:M23 family metallopeptidase [Clostridia bacterium]